MISKRATYLIETDELAAAITEGKPLKIIDGSWFPDQDAAALFLESRVTKDTVHFDIKTIVEPGSDLIFRFPSQDVFATHMKALDIQKNQSIVVYDQSPAGLFTAARVAYMLRHYGVADVRLLNGGMKKWKAEGRTVVSGPVENAPTEQAGGDYGFVAADASKVVMDIGVMHDYAGKLFKAEDAKQLDFQVLDARDAGGFGKASIKNSVNVPHTDLIAEDGTIKSDAEIKAVFDAAGVDSGKQSICSCGGGVTACVVELGLLVLGNENKTSLYDGSW